MSVASDEYRSGLWPEQVDPEHVLPEELILGDTFYEYKVIIEKAETIKPYIGGYRDKQTGKLYHNAISQTQDSSCFEKFRKKVTKDTANQNTRETQTQEQKHNSSQCYREYGTQMDRSDLILDTKTDHMLSPNQYMTAEELHQLKSEQATTIQKLWRRGFARLVCTRLRAFNLAKHQALEAER